MIKNALEAIAIIGFMLAVLLWAGLLGARAADDCAPLVFMGRRMPCGEGTSGKPSGEITVTGAITQGTWKADNPKNWSLVIQRATGKIEVLGKYEKQAECETAKDVARGRPTTEQEKAYAYYFGHNHTVPEIVALNPSYVVTSNDIADAACLDW